MDRAKYTMLVEALAAVPDARKARGKRYPWTLLLTRAKICRSPHAYCLIWVSAAGGAFNTL